MCLLPYDALGNVQDYLMTVESLQYDFTTLQYATNNFSDFLKIGEGGFGVVYKVRKPIL